MTFKLLRAQPGRPTRTLESPPASAIYESPPKITTRDPNKMTSRDLTTWMWGDALSLLEQADRLHRQFFHAGGAEVRCWEPPVDVLESQEALTILVALPGVSTNDVAVRFDEDGVHIVGLRRFPATSASRIHRIEIPYGRFERHISLPLTELEPQTPEMTNGCLVLSFRKRREAR
ncbi:Hsp20/alpha crystallin family protein [Uliginosibacterium sp. H3]|uniref:Hsp20/alpha crystallin family protein n=1 Tax=Uliginosibacterium silvisoli TaxID=3114758 RepID=A0ABU6JYF8_9RHOO|nr:Hsp20/alpha crystallin family protein [Uliginosibacterium sp. H3]